jgi:hypothetical protein
MGLSAVEPGYSTLMAVMPLVGLDGDVTQYLGLPG